MRFIGWQRSLPKVDIVRPATVIGRGTVGAMQSGMFWGYLSMIEGLLTRIQGELSLTGDPPVTVIVTGGLVPSSRKPHP